LDNKGRMVRGCRPVIDGTLQGPDALIELVAFHFTDGIYVTERDLPRSSSFVNSTKLRKQSSGVENHG